MENQHTTEDDTFDRLRRVDFPTLEARLSRISDGHYATINPMTFIYSVAKPYHQYIIGSGWTVDEFNTEINKVLNRYKTNDNK